MMRDAARVTPRSSLLAVRATPRSEPLAAQKRVTDAR
jgi:hypothetical protein